MLVSKQVPKMLFPNRAPDLTLMDKVAHNAPTHLWFWGKGRAPSCAEAEWEGCQPWGLDQGRAVDHCWRSLRGGWGLCSVLSSLD